MSDAIVVGDWVVAGTTSDTLDMGQILRIEDDGVTASVSWQSCATTPCDLSADDVEVYGSKREAARRYAERDAEEA